MTRLDLVLAYNSQDYHLYQSLVAAHHLGEQYRAALSRLPSQTLVEKVDEVQYALQEKKRDLVKKHTVDRSDTDTPQEDLDRLKKAIRDKANETGNCGLCGGNEADIPDHEEGGDHYAGCPVKTLERIEEDATDG